jgi:hypothetical protein
MGARHEKASKHRKPFRIWGGFFIFLSQTDLDRVKNVAVDQGQCQVE